MKLIPWKHKKENSTALARRPTERFRGEIEDLFRPPRGESWPAALLDWFERGQDWGPRMELSETDRDLTLRFELPGVRTEDLDISLSGNVLTLTGEKSEQRDERRGRLHFSERSFGRFSRSVQIPSTADPDKVDAAYKDGVLVVTIGKRPDARARKVAVRSK